MFEKAVLVGAPRRDGLTLGKVAEALLFYRAVHLVLDTGSVLELVRVLGVDGLIELLTREGVTATFVEGMPVTMTDSIGPLKAHRFDFMSIVPEGVPQGLLKGRRQVRMAPVAQRLLREGVSKAQTAKLVGALVDLVPNKNLGAGDFGAGLPAVALGDLQDEAYSHPALRLVLESMVPAELVPKEFKVRVQESDLGFYLFGDLRIDEIEAARLKLGLPGEPITEAGVIGKLLQARVELSQGAYYGGDFRASPQVSSLVKLRCESLLTRAGLHQTEIAAFEDIVLEDYPCVAEVIDAGERSMSDFMKLLDKAGSFRRWAYSVGPDRQIVSAYLEEVARQDWVQTTKGKSLRYVLGLATGLDVLVGPAFAALDTFGIDSIAQRWRASHFVDKRLKPFLDG